MNLLPVTSFLQVLKPPKDPVGLILVMEVKARKLRDWPSPCPKPKITMNPDTRLDSHENVICRGSYQAGSFSAAVQVTTMKAPGRNVQLLQRAPRRNSLKPRCLDITLNPEWIANPYY